MLVHLLDFLFAMAITGGALLVCLYVFGVFPHPKFMKGKIVQPELSALPRVSDYIRCDFGHRLNVEYFTGGDQKHSFMVKLTTGYPCLTLPLDSFWRQLCELMDRAANREPGRLTQQYDCDDCRAEFKYASLSSGKAPRFCPECGKDSSRQLTAIEGEAN